MGSSNSRHVSQTTAERRDRGDYPAATRRESQVRRPSGREKYRPGRLCTGRFSGLSSSRRNGGSSSSPSSNPDLGPSASGRRNGTVAPKENLSATTAGVAEDSNLYREGPAECIAQQHTHPETTSSPAASDLVASTSSIGNTTTIGSSSTASSSDSNALPGAEATRPLDDSGSIRDYPREHEDGRSAVGAIGRITENEGSGMGLVMEIVPVAVVSPRAAATQSNTSHRSCGMARQARVGFSESRSSWLEGHPPWTSRLESSAGSSGLSGSASGSDLGSASASGSGSSSGSGSGSASGGLSQLARPSAPVCEMSNPQRRNEMQELIRRSSGYGPTVDIRDFERGVLRAREPVGGQGERTGNASSSSGNDRDDFPFQTTPASLQAWEITEEGALIQYRHYSDSSWERHLAFQPSESQSLSTSSSTSASSGSVPSGSSSSSTPISSTAAGRESRRNGGRRLWDTFLRAASHRRNANPITASSEGSVDGWSQPDDHMDIRSLNSRSLDLEERRRRVRSQVWALQLLNNGLDGLSRPCTAGCHHHGHSSCDVHSSAEDTSTRASIYRIMMLAEALFEVLDEIHRQSVALSRTSAPIASLPAPDTVVDAIPMKKFSKKVLDEATQCNICLVEYEDGDQVRVLPCHHEYHMACVDKWLKEVHRVCPLCRGNVCEANSGGAEHLSSPS